MAKKAASKKYEYQAEMKQLLSLLANSLYSNKETFLREIISNASDALNKLRFRKLTDKNVLDADQELSISITADPESNTVTITDTGIGMTEDDLISRLGTIASSGTLAFVQEMEEEGKGAEGDLIGKFGVGFYSVFMVAKKVEVETRSADPDSSAFKWTSDGAGTFSITESDRTERGTSIKLFLRAADKDFSQEANIKKVVQHYSSFVDFPIYVSGTQVNTVEALWKKHKSEVTDEALNEFYKYLTHDWNEPLDHLHLRLEGRLNFDALLFIPQQAPPGVIREESLTGLDLYSSTVFIQNDCRDLLPEYLRFIKGVVDTSDLPLNVSREVTQNSPVMGRIRSSLTSKVLGLLSKMSKKEPEKFAKFTNEFGILFKSGLNTDMENRDKIVELMRFESTKSESGGFVSLREYVDRMKEDQEDIYFITGDSRQQITNNPKLEYFLKNDIEVMLLVDPMDVFVLPGVGTYDEKAIKSIERADLDLKSEAKDGDKTLKPTEIDKLIALFKVTLDDRVADVMESHRLVDSAATLVVPENGMDSQMERMMKYMNKDFQGTKKVLEINPEHPLLQNMAKMQSEGADQEFLEAAASQIFEGALLIEGSLEEPAAFVRRMTEMMVRASAGKGEV